MELPEWADSEASQQLAVWIASGESVSQEFKEDIPEQTRKLAQEIAAMGTSGGGRILLGVSDAGLLKGLPVNDAATRDDLFERVQGIADTVRPDVNVELAFAFHDDRTVLVVSVPLQSAPIFYVDQRPYIRDNRRSRPARPSEVVDCVWAHPSSEHQREKERLHLRQLTDIMESGRRSREHFGRGAP